MHFSVPNLAHITGLQHVEFTTTFRRFLHSKLRRPDGKLLDATVPGIDEIDRTATVIFVCVDVPGDGRRSEVIEGHEEIHPDVVCDEIFKHEEADIAAEVVKKGEEVAAARENGREWTVLVHIMTANAFERQIEAVRNRTLEPPRTIDGLLAIDPITREDHHPADGVRNRQECFILLVWKLLRDRFERLPLRKRWYH